LLPMYAPLFMFPIFTPHVCSSCMLPMYAPIYTSHMYNTPHLCCPYMFPILSEGKIQELEQLEGEVPGGELQGEEM
jgi:hypothetical protein